MRRLPFLLAALLVAAPAAASPLNPWGAHAGEGVFALTPFLYADQGPNFYPYVYGQYGITGSFEVLAGASAYLGSESGFDAVELMPRYFLSEASAAVLHLTWAPGSDPSVAPELHGVYTLGPVDLTVNAGWGPTLGSEGFSAGAAYAFLAPEYYFTEATSVFLEIDPSFDLAEYPEGAEVDRLYVELVPGVSTAIAETHYFALGVALPVVPVFDAEGIYAGMWYSVAFGGEYPSRP